WLYEGLTAAGLPAVCLETRHAKAAMGAMPNKTDRNDARAIARIVRTGWFRAVHVKSPACRSWRALLAARRLVLNKMRDVENGLRALLREAGLKLGTPARKELAARVRELTAADPVLSALAEPLLTIIAAMTCELARLTRRVLEIARGEPDVQGGISRCGDELARTALYEAAHSLLVRSRKWSTLRAWGMQVARRRGLARARIAVARKLSTILHRMWIDGSDFRWGKEGP